MLKAGCIFTIIALIGLTMVAVAGCSRRTPEKRAERFVKKIASKLNLDASQKQKLETIKTELLDHCKSMRTRHEADYNNLLKELEKETIDKKQLKNMVDLKLAKMEELSDQFIESYGAFHAGLTPDQRTKLITLIKDKKKWHDRCFHRKQE